MAHPTKKMFPSKFSFLLLSLALFASHIATTTAEKNHVVGYLIDNQCIKLCTDQPPGAECAPDGSNVFYNPQDHTGWCLLLSKCVESGYSLMSSQPRGIINGYKHQVVFELSGPESQAAVLEYIRAGTRGAFPKVAVVFDDQTDLVQDSEAKVTRVYNATIVDPWDASVNALVPTIPVSKYWSGRPTTQQVCNTMAKANIELNNYCFRSDVLVTEQTISAATHAASLNTTSTVARSGGGAYNDGPVIIIESNGCPDHANMQGGSNGTIANNQEPVDLGFDASFSGGTGGGCGCGSCGCGCGGCGSCGGCGCGSCGSCGCGSCGSCGACGACGACGSACGSCGSSGACGAACGSNACGSNACGSTAKSANNIFSHQDRRLQNDTSDACGACGTSCGADSCGAGCGSKDNSTCSACGACGARSCGADSYKKGTVDVPGVPITVDYELGYDNGYGAETFTATVSYTGSGWVAFGISPDGNMVGSTAVLVIPGDGTTSPNPGIYQLNDQAISGLTLDTNATLVASSYAQKGGVTTLTFTKLVAEEGSVPINTTGENFFLVAGGSDNTLGYHGSTRASFVVSFAPPQDCGAGCGAACGACGACGGCGCGSCGNCGGCGCGCGCGSCGCGCGCGESGGSGHGSHSHGTYEPLYQHYTMAVPKQPSLGERTVVGDDVVGMLFNGVLLDSHKQTWAYDVCNGHSDKKHQYHYHIPPICLLESMGIAFADSPSWWINDNGTATRNFSDLASQFPQSASPSPVIGLARDGHPIYGLYDDKGALQRSAPFGGDVDECNGKTDASGNYGYYLTVDPPFAPACLKGKVGLFTYATSDLSCPKEGIQNEMLADSSSGTAPPGDSPTDAPQNATSAPSAGALPVRVSWAASFGAALLVLQLLVAFN